MLVDIASYNVTDEMLLLLEFITFREGKCVSLAPYATGNLVLVYSC